MLYKGTTTPGMGHPDFQNDNYVHGVVTGLVKSTLGADSEPVFASTGGGGKQSLTNATDFCWWYHEDNCTAGASNPFDKLVYLDKTGNPTTLTLSSTGTNIYQYDNQSFYPVDGLGWNAGANPQTDQDCGGGPAHNFSFTSELHYPFTYKSSGTAPKFDFTGDDDVWVFINGHLAVDL